jgi:dihydrofolate reductase
MPGKPDATASRVTLHMVSSLDGFIARKDNTVSWLDVDGVYEAGVCISAEEAEAFVKAIDCYVLGSRTYEHALELGWPYGDTPTVVVTNRKEWPAARKSVEFYSGNLKTLVDVKLASRFRNIWLVGGAMLSQRFLELGLVDEIRLTIAPVLLGDGLRLFACGLKEEKWKLKNVVAYKNGFVELNYAALAAAGSIAQN